MKEQLYRIESKLDLLLAKKKTVKRKPVEYSEDFERVWVNYPNRSGSNPKNKAWSAYRQRLKERVGSENLFWGAVNYKKFCDATNKTGTEFVMQTATFFGTEKYYSNDWKLPITTEAPPKDNNNLEAWAVGKGIRTARPGETWGEYRKLVTALYANKDEA